MFRSPRRPARVRLAVAGMALLGLPLGAVPDNLAQTPQIVEHGILRLHYWPGGEELAQRLLDRARQAPPLPGLPAGILHVGEPVNIFLAPDEQRFDSLTAGRAPEWSAGTAMPGAGIIVLPGFAGRGAVHELHRVLRHELAHIALYRHVGDSRIPRWFDEGYARWAARQWDWEAGWKLRLAFAFNRAPPLDSLSLTWPRAQPDAEIAYYLAASAVAYLVEQSGELGLRLFLERWQEDGSFESALWRTYGLTPGQLEEHWRRWVERRYGWAFFLSHSIIFWAIAGLVLLSLFGLRRRRDSERRKALRASEPPDDPAYWLASEQDLPRRFQSETPPDTTNPADSGDEDSRAAPHY